MSGQFIYQPFPFSAADVRVDQHAFRLLTAQALIPYFDRQTALLTKPLDKLVHGRGRGPARTIHIKRQADHDHCHLLLPANAKNIEDYLLGTLYRQNRQRQRHHAQFVADGQTNTAFTIIYAENARHG